MHNTQLVAIPSLSPVLDCCWTDPERDRGAIAISVWHALSHPLSLPQTQPWRRSPANRLTIVAMRDLCSLIWCAVVGLFRSRVALQAEILVLRHQLNVLRRKSPRRVALGNIDRAVLIGLKTNGCCGEAEVSQPNERKRVGNVSFSRNCYERLKRRNVTVCIEAT